MLLAGVGDYVESGHHQTGTVADDADLPVELDVVQVLLLRLLLERVGSGLVLELCVVLVPEVGVLVERDLPVERFEVFGDFNPDDHAAEVEERWGDTEGYKESQRRAARNTKEDWQLINAEGQAAVDMVVAAMNGGMPADSQEAMDGAEAHRRQINDAFYDLSYQGHVGLAEMYLADARFTATYEKIAPGLAQYLHDAIKANAAARGA